MIILKKKLKNNHFTNYNNNINKKMQYTNRNPNRQNKTNEYYKDQRDKIKNLNKNKKIISKQILNRWEKEEVEYNNCNTVNTKEISISNPGFTSYIPANSHIRPSVWMNLVDYEDYED
jgi:hypothetical protein